MEKAKGKKFSGKLLYVNQNIEKMDEISQQQLEDFILHVKLSNPYFTYYASTTRDSNIDILKSALSDEIVNVEVYTCPMKGYPKPLLHAYAVFQTKNKENEVMWWSFDKNGHHIVLQQSQNKEDVIKKIYKYKKKIINKRPEPIKEEETAKAHGSLKNLLRLLWGQFSYHLNLSNCWQFAKFVFEKINREDKKWKPPVAYETLKKLNPFSKTAIEQHGLDPLTVMGLSSSSIDVNASLRLAMIDNDFCLCKLKQLTDKKPEIIKRVDCQGYTLLDWAHILSKDDDIINYLKKKGVQSSPGNKLFIALLSKNNKELEKLVEDENLVNATNSLDETPLHLAVKLASCSIQTFEKLFEKVENINKVDKYGYTPLHWAIYVRSLEKMKLLIGKGVDMKIHVNDVNEDSPLHLAVQRWSNSTETTAQKTYLKN